MSIFVKTGRRDTVNQLPNERKRVAVLCDGIQLSVVDAEAHLALLVCHKD